MKGGLVLIRLVRGIKQTALQSSSTKSHERRACPRPSGTWKQVGVTSSIRYEVMRKESLSTSVWYDESCRQDFVHQVQSSVKEVLVLVRPVRGIQQAGLRLSGTKSHERTASPHPSGMKSRKGRISTFVRFEELSRRDFAFLVRSRAIGGHIIVRLVYGIKHAGLRPSSMKSHKMRACPHPSSTRNQVGWTLFIRYEVRRKKGLSSSV